MVKTNGNLHKNFIYNSLTDCLFKCVHDCLCSTDNDFTGQCCSSYYQGSVRDQCYQRQDLSVTMITVLMDLMTKVHRTISDTVELTLKYSCSCDIWERNPIIF